MIKKGNCRIDYSTESLSVQYIELLKALIISLILLALFLIIIYSFSNSLNFLSQSSAVNSGFKTRTIDTAYTTNTFFYITNFLNFLFAGKITFYKNIPTLYNPTLTSYLVMFITILGLILGLTTKFKNKKEYFRINYKIYKNYFNR